MQRLTSRLALAVALFGGCTTTRPLRRPETADQLHALVWKKRSHITLLYNHPEGATSPVPPSLALAAGPPGADEGVPLDDVSTLRGYEVKRRGLGALEGVAWGTVLGLMTGAMIGLSQQGSSCQNVDTACVEITSGDWAIFGGAVGAISGHVLGAIIGALVGHTDRYVFSP